MRVIDQVTSIVIDLCASGIFCLQIDHLYVAHRKEIKVMDYYILGGEVYLEFAVDGCGERLVHVRGWRAWMIRMLDRVFG